MDRIGEMSPGGRLCLATMKKTDGDKATVGHKATPGCRLTLSGEE